MRIETESTERTTREATNYTNIAWSLHLVLTDADVITGTNPFSKYCITDNCWTPVYKCLVERLRMLKRTIEICDERRKPLLTWYSLFVNWGRNIVSNKSRSLSPLLILPRLLTQWACQDCTKCWKPLAVLHPYWSRQRVLSRWDVSHCSVWQFPIGHLRNKKWCSAGICPCPHRLLGSILQFCFQVPFRNTPGDVFSTGELMARSSSYWDSGRKRKSSKWLYVTFYLLMTQHLLLTAKTLCRRWSTD